MTERIDVSNPEKTMNGYHFHGETLRNGLAVPPIGEWLVCEGPIIPCKSGLHASEQPFDALQYASGAILDRVELDGELVSHGDPVDKWVGRRRKRLASIDSTELLRKFACECALSVIDKWDAPPVVREYLTTRDPKLQADAWASAQASAQAAAGDAARAWNDDKAAARAAAVTATAADAWHTAKIAAQAAARADAGAWNAACNTAWDAAFDTAWDAQMLKFQQTINSAFSL